jgi:tetratricopeptide (TPR) repeat protein
VAQCLNNRGTIESLQGKFVDAEATYREAIAIDMATFGEDGPATLNGLNNLAQLFIQLKDRAKLEEAEEILQSVEAKRLAVLGDKHVDYATSLCDLGIVRMDLGKFEEAKKNIHAAIAIWKSQEDG